MMMSMAAHTITIIAKNSLGLGFFMLSPMKRDNVFVTN